ncbi:3ea84547-26b0-4dc7-8e08-a7316e3afb86 [Sclerotinia trifoliorum]|uniref:3ea84547-26b0-4dc7-8e08-a7316e3afb86 n=1 Tax=Sclerotinia trifoliorum TaxID=28548 RepID=A0A8H2ZTL5_9HELO|nr:3ea84547-26b0-4dc7-8e08-a7316e3afb86 [Sclerotinia trifoliorum]
MDCRRYCIRLWKWYDIDIGRPEQPRIWTSGMSFYLRLLGNSFDLLHHEHNFEPNASSAGNTHSHSSYTCVLCHRNTTHLPISSWFRKLIFATFVNEGGWSTQALSVFVGMNGNTLAFVGTDGPVHKSRKLH